jgi:hypothetical protein
MNWRPIRGWTKPLHERGMKAGSMPERLLIGPGSPPSIDPVYPELSPPPEPCPATAAESSHTTSSPAPRNRIAWAKLIKWVVGENGTNFWSHSGMLSSGVVPPDSRRSPERYDHPTQRERLGGQSRLT